MDFDFLGEKRSVAENSSSSEDDKLFSSDAGDDVRFMISCCL